MAELKDHAGFNARITDAYREIGDSINDLRYAEMLCELAASRIHDTGFCCAADELKHERLSGGQRHFVVSEDDMSVLFYAVRQVEVLAVALEGTYDELWTESRAQDEKPELINIV
jgi:hypothetical protein